jgi:hypothetical protein
MRWTVLATITATTIALAATPADAQQKRSKRPLIVVRPDVTSPIDWNDPLRWRPLTQAELRASARVVRRCVDGYAIEQRPSGTVLTPRMRCWWAIR